MHAPQGAKNNVSAKETPVIKLYCQMPPIAKLDNSLNTLKNCEHLSLSTNCIDRLIPLSGMKKLRTLSLGRNQIKKIEKLDDVSDTLEEMWISYNVIATLDGLSGFTNLTTLYVSNNLIKSWDELDKLANLPKLRDVLFVGNPIYENMSKEEQRLNVLKRIRKSQKSTATWSSKRSATQLWASNSSIRCDEDKQRSLPIARDQ